MTFIKKLALALCLAGSFSFSNAQQVDSTGNLINNNNWSGVGAYAPDPNDCCGNPAGSQPLYDTNTDTIKFSYGQTTVGQAIGINTALSGSGIQVEGYNWGYELRNMNGRGGQGGVDTLTARILTYAPDNVTLRRSDSWTHNTQFDWTAFSGTVNYNVPGAPSEFGNIRVEFEGRDSGFWAGLYGPEVRNVSLSLRYSVDPCVANPLYASHCTGFNDIVLSGNLVPNPNGIYTWGQSMDQTFAIATALQHGGLGVQVHGFEWGFDAFVGNTYYAGAFWSDFRDPDLYTNVTIRDSAGNVLYSRAGKGEYDDKQYWTSYNYSYVLPQSTNSLNLGNFEFTAQTVDYTGIDNAYVRARYTPDQCVLNPLSSVSCTGYQQAFYDQQCTANSLYDSGCPGYAQAYYDQQCSIDALYDSGCPGYETAYFNYQCTQNPLYNNACPGYAQAYFDQQCGLSALYNTQCPGYAEAKILKDLQEQLAAPAESTVETSTVASTGAPSTTASSATVALADPTRTETVVTTDVGGVELTTTGEISIPTGEPAAAKEAVKEAVKEEEKKQEEKKAEGEKKRVDPRALAVARAAAREAEATALSTAENAVEFSQSDTATSAALGLGTGITIGGFRPLGVGEGTEEDGKATQTTSTSKDSNLNAQNNTATQGQQQDVAQKTGPAVRNGGKVEGMEGGPDPAQLARAPMDFNQYLNAQLRDAQFYASKDIYKGQRNVDNQRLLRGLTGGSDRLHEQMINQQYNITGQ